MGAYINPPDMTKEEWLDENAVEVPLREFKWANTPDGYLPIVLVNNGAFTAAAIAFSEREFDAFTGSQDKRQKMFFYALEDDLRAVSPELSRYQERNR